MQRAFQEVLRFFGTIATALAGLGALATSLGFLAERTRWSMLGFGGAPTNLNEYLFTGARFLAFLPGTVLASTLTALTASLVGLLVVAVIVIALLALRRVRRWRGRAVRSAAAGAALGDWVPRFRPWALGALAIAQFAGALYLFEAGRLRNLLFMDRAAVAGVECGVRRLALEQQILLGCEPELTDRMGRAFLIVLLGAGGLWLLTRAAPRSSTGAQDSPRADAAAADGEPATAVSATPPHGGAVPVLLGVNLALLAAQLVLLPINYGALFLRNEFQVVDVTLARGELGLDVWPDDGRVFLLDRQGDEFYLYAASAHRVWMLPRAEIETLTFRGLCGVFEPLERCGLGTPAGQANRGSP